MITLNPIFLGCDGKKAFVVPYEEFEKVRKELNA